MTDMTDLAALGGFPAGAATYGYGFQADPDPLGSILLVQPNSRDGAAPLDRSRSLGGDKIITALNGAKITTRKKRYGSGSLECIRTSKQGARITPFDSFAFGTGQFGFGGNFNADSDGLKMTLFSSGASAGCYQLIKRADNGFDFVIKGGGSTAATPAAWPILPAGITATRYVDAVNGSDGNTGLTPATAWKTLSKAASTLTAGQAAEFADGNYTGSLTQTNNGTLANPIVFYAKNRHGAKLLHPASSGHDMAFEMRGDYTHLIGFEVDGSTYSTGTRWRFGPVADGTKSRVAFCKVHDISMNTASPVGGGAGILLEFFHNKLGQIAEGNEVYRIGPLGGTSSTLHAIYWTGEAEIINNTCYQVVGVGAHGYHSPRNSVVENNTFDGMKYGVYFGWAGAGSSYNGWPGPTDNVRVRNNIVMNTTNQAYFEEGTCTNSVYANNTHFNAAGGGFSLFSATPTNTLTTNPQFTNSSARDYSLLAASPSRNSGSATEAPSLDILGYSRPQEGTVDRGAREYIVPGAAADVVHSTTGVAVAKDRDCHVWAERDAANNLRIKVEGKTFLTVAAFTTDLKATQALVGVHDPAAATPDGFNGCADGFQAVAGSPLYQGDFGPGPDAIPPPETATEYYVAASGSDANPGTLASPFLTLEKARDAMRASSTAKKTYLRGGTYVLANELVLDAGDSNTRYENYNGEAVTLTGAETLTGFALEGGNLYSKSTTETGLDVFMGDIRLRPAQLNWSSVDPIRSGQLVMPADGTTTTVKMAVGAVPSGDFQAGLKIQAYDRERLADLIGDVTAIDSGTNTISFTPLASFAPRQGGTFALLNRAAHINGDGQFGWRASDAKLVVRPTTTDFETIGLHVGRLGRYITLQGATGVMIKGLRFKWGKYDTAAIRLELNASSNTIEDCVFVGVGTGIDIREVGTDNNLIQRNSFTDLGYHGVLMVRPGTGNRVEKNSFTRVGRIRKDAAAVQIFGGTNTAVRYNDIDGSPRYGVSSKTFNAGDQQNGNVIEFNVIKNIGFETADLGGIEALGRTSAATNLVVRGNWIENVQGLATDAAGTWLSGPFGYKGFGVYLDDMTSDALVERNYVRNTSWAAFFIHGGDRNRIERNVVVLENEQHHLLRLEHQPNDATNGLPMNNVFGGNVVYASTALTDYRQTITPGPFTANPNLVFRVPALTGDITGDPLFTDFANGNVRLLPASPAFQLTGFTELPYELMGVDGVIALPGTPPVTGYPSDKGGFLGQGNQILDGAMKPVRFTGCNWNGAEWDDNSGVNLIPGGLTQRTVAQIIGHMKSLGFNLIRLPFSDTTVVSTSTNHGFATGLNPSFAGKTKRDIIGLVCREARAQGVYVLLDHHRNNANTGAGTQQGFLEGDGFTLQNIIDNWKTLVTHPDIFGNPAVLGCDVHNEPNGTAFNWSVWAPKAEQIGNAILSVNPNVMIIVEGNEISYRGGGQEWEWWGGNLEDFQDRPIVLTRPDKLVMSVHDYGPYLVGPKPWHNDPSFPANMFGPNGVYDHFWGYIWRQKRHPMFIGEFGARFEQPVSQALEFTWVQALHKYMNGDLNNTGQLFLAPGEVGMSWTMWTYTPYSGDTGGIVGNDFVTVQTNRYNQYKDHLWPLKGGVIVPPPQIRVDGTRI